jgi:hypothetical protein
LYICTTNRLKLFSKIVKDKLRDNNSIGKSDIDQINKDIAKQRQRISNARVLMLDGEIDALEF